MFVPVPEIQPIFYSVPGKALQAVHVKLPVSTEEETWDWAQMLLQENCTCTKLPVQNQRQRRGQSYLNMVIPADKVLSFLKVKTIRVLTMLTSLFRMTQQLEGPEKQIF